MAGDLKECCANMQQIDIERPVKSFSRILEVISAYAHPRLRYRSVSGARENFENFNSCEDNGVVRIHRCTTCATDLILTGLCGTEKQRRAEVVPLWGQLRESKFPPYGQDISYSFSFKFSKDTIKTGNYSFSQWHGVPNKFLGERDGRPPMLIGISKGNYFLATRASRKLVMQSPKTGQLLKRFDMEMFIDLGRAECDAEKWVEWCLQARWSYKDDGHFRLLKDGVMLVERSGQNCFNDLRGAPYMQFGVYKLRSDDVCESWPEVAFSYRDLKIRTLR